VNGGHTCDLTLGLRRHRPAGATELFPDGFDQWFGAMLLFALGPLFNVLPDIARPDSLDPRLRPPSERRLTFNVGISELPGFVYRKH